MPELKASLRVLVWAGVAAVGLAHAGRAGAGVAFSAPTLEPLSNVRSVVAADVTGDGRTDLVVRGGAGDGLDRLVVIAQNADGSLAAPQTLAVLPAGGRLLAADVNGDGRTDLVATTPSGVEIFLQGVGGLSSSPLLIPVEAALAVAVGDVTGDGRKDIVVATGPTGSVGPRLDLLTNTGSGYSLSVLRDDGFYYPDVAIADVTGDGKPDVVTFHDLGSTDGVAEVVVLRRLSDGSFSDSTYMADPGFYRYGYALKVGDVTGDGRPDVVLSYNGNQIDPPLKPGSEIEVLAATPSGSLARAAVYETYDAAQALAIADLNRDGRADVLVAHGGFDAWGELPQLADGTLGGEVLFPVPANSNTTYDQDGLAVGDLNGDRRLDVAVADQNHGLLVYSQLASPGETPPTTSIVSGPPSTTSNPTATITAASPTAVRLQCSIDGSPFAFYCDEGFQMTLPDGTHTFRVRAIDAAGNTDPIGASYTWTICCTGRVSNDDFLGAQRLSGEGGSVSGSNVGATVEPFEPYPAGSAAGDSIWYSWTPPVSGRYSFSTAGSDFSTALAAYTGRFLDGLSPVAADGDMNSPTPSSLITFPAQAGTTYWITVDGRSLFAGGPSGTVHLTWQLVDTQPNLLGNGSFEDNFVGWTGSDATLALATHIALGLQAAEITPTSQASYGIESTPDAIGTTVTNATYRASAFIRSNDPGSQVCLTIDAATSHGTVGSTPSCLTTTDEWQSLPTASYTATNAGEPLTISIQAQGGASFDTDGVWITGTVGPPPTSPPTSPPPAPTPTPAPGPTPSPAPTPSPITPETTPASGSPTAAVADLAVSISSTTPAVTEGGSDDLVVTITNNGAAAAAGSHLVLQLPPRVVLLARPAAGGGVVGCTGTNTIDCSLNNIPAGSSIHLVLHVRIDATGTETVTATVSVEGEGSSNTSTASLSLESKAASSQPSNVAATLTGRAVVGQTLTVHTPAGLHVLGYQWQITRAGTSWRTLTGARGRTLSIRAAYLGARLRARILLAGHAPVTTPQSQLVRRR